MALWNLADFKGDTYSFVDGGGVGERAAAFAFRYVCPTCCWDMSLQTWHIVAVRNGRRSLVGQTPSPRSSACCFADTVGITPLLRRRTQLIIAGCADDYPLGPGTPTQDYAAVQYDVRRRRGLLAAKRADVCIAAVVYIWRVRNSRTSWSEALRNIRCKASAAGSLVPHAAPPPAASIRLAADVGPVWRRARGPPRHPERQGQGPARGGLQQAHAGAPPTAAAHSST